MGSEGGEKEMGSGSFGFDNKTRHKNQGASSNYVLLQKDCKNICRARVCDLLPIEVPFEWPIVKFVPANACQKSACSRFSLLPAPEDSRQNLEWGKFMRFLWDHKRAGIVAFGSSTLHILASQPDENTKFARAELMYEHEQNVSGDCKQTAGTSVTHVNIPKSSKKSEFQHSSRNPKPYFNEEMCESVLNPTEMDTSHKHQELLVTEAHRSVLQSSPFEAVEDGFRVLNPLAKKGTAAIENFFKISFSFLQTLGEAHSCWTFGALSELIDNSRDAGTSRLKIFIESMFWWKENREIPVLCVIDDGHGMTYADMMRMVTLGHQGPNERGPDKIGKFGVGFKTGAMNLGKEAIVLTQTKSSKSVAFLSQSFNQEKTITEIPVVTYRKNRGYMEFDLSVQSKDVAEYNLDAIKKFSPFNEYSFGEKLGLYGNDGTGTQVYIWDLAKWGADYTLEWNSGKSTENPVHNGRGDILIRERRARSRPGQTNNKVLLDYSLQSYLEVMFLNPRMKITVQGSLVNSRPLAKTLNKTSVISGEIMGRPIQLTLGMSKVEWDRMNCGIFLYWRGRLIEMSYKRVGGQKHSADMGRGLIGVADITDLDYGDGHALVLNNKQGFRDCEMYVKLVEWLGRKVDEYWSTRFDNLELREGGENYKADHEWVQCYSCRKWRVLPAGFNSETLPDEWFCKMPPFNGRCDIPEQKMARGVVVVGEKRPGSDEQNRIAQQEKKQLRSGNIEVQTTAQDEEDVMIVQDTPVSTLEDPAPADGNAMSGTCLDRSDGRRRSNRSCRPNARMTGSEWTGLEGGNPPSKRRRRGPVKSYKE
ncbi:hypothetical protein ACP70R_044181 [Stipagrostis hirtigluma subsp. patula]